MKKILLTLCVVTLSLSANTKNDNTVLLKSLMKEVKTLKQEVVSLKKSKTQYNQSIDDIYENIDRVEAEGFQNKINFGLGFKTNLDNFTKTYADGHKVFNNNIWSNKLMLNMKANITDNMNFYGRLSMYKYWGSSYIHPYTYYDNMQGRVPSDSSLYVERAYINWFLFKDSLLPIAFTIGRQPSSDGPSNQFKDNTKRKGTYSALLYDGAADGIVFTANISKLIKLPKSYLRFGYAKGFGYSQTIPNVSNAFIGASNNDIKDTNIAGFFLDTTVPNVQNSFIQVSYSKMLDIVANPLDKNSSQNKNIGDVDLYGAMVQFTNINNTHLDLFAQYGYSHAKPNKNSYIDNGVNYGGLLGDTSDTTTKDGHSFWLGSRYGFGKKQKYKFGLEYNQGSKNWINLTQGSFDIYNKLATRGNAIETYMMYVINRYANLRIGYVNIDYKYTRSGWFVGKSRKISNSMDNVQNIVDNLKSVYLKMSVHF
ncbi:DUF3373 family protein [Sulfurimonas sp.]|uniref:DUF3373 family protein n=1 Tax=Sulfurimonas sp. TaxID=2022749 RepID=UPI00262C2F7C|nr:DUF3373 family protein [Sulfurimonas sp.]